MAKKLFICVNCGDPYYSKKENSRFCSLDCKYSYNRYKYNCDYCGKEIIIYKNEYEKLKSGQKKNKYCSKECKDKGAVTSEEKICINCGKIYRAFNCEKEKSKYCSQECYNEYRNKNARINIPRICPICNKTFYSDRKNPKYCSSECTGISQKKRVIINCCYCGNEFECKEYRVLKYSNLYCSTTCRMLDQKWNINDVEILENNYRKIKTKDIVPLLSKPYTVKAIRAEAERRDLTKSRLWSDKEIELLKDLYPKIPMSEVLKALPNRSIPSIMGKTRVLGLTSYFYNQRMYTEDEINYLKDNYLTKTNKELGIILGRNPNAIQQRLWIMNLYRPFDPKSVCYKDVARYIRAQNETWRNHIFDINNYTCYLSGKYRDVVIHHCRGFNIILQEAIDDIDFEIKEDFSDYNTRDLRNLYNHFSELQEYYGEYVCINKEIHKLFHVLYGYGNNTMQQWSEFEKNFKNGKYENDINL